MQVYGYCRISTPRQNIERQVRNIAAAYPAAHIVREVYTGTASQGRKELDKLLRCVQPGDTIVFDSVSRMSRSAEEGCALYEALYPTSIRTPTNRPCSGRLAPRQPPAALQQTVLFPV